MLEGNDTLCRVCLCFDDKKESTCLSAILREASISDHIEALTRIKVTEENWLPTTICSDCLLELETALNFKEKCEKSNIILQLRNSYHALKVELTKEKLFKELMEDADTFSDSNGEIAAEANSCIEVPVSFEDNKVSEEPENKTLIATKLQCNECGEFFSSKCKLRVHWKKKHLPTDLICPYCKRKYRAYERFNNHLRKRNGSCKFAESDNVRIEGEGKSRVFFCTRCNYTSRYITGVVLHAVTHSGDKPFQCDLCALAFTQRAPLDRHRERVHKKYKVQITCQYCGQIVRGRDRVYMHLKSHTDTKVQCDICKKMYRNKQTLEIHIQSHSGIKKFKCEICSKKYYTKSALCTHKRANHYENRFYFYCDLCKYKARRNETLKKHKLKHNSKDLPCEVCGKFLKSNEELIKHQKFHFDKNNKCPYCDMKYYKKNTLNNHIYKNHKGLKIKKEDFDTN